MQKISNTFFYQLEKTVKTYRQYFQAQMKTHGFDITLDQWLILNTILDYPNASQTEIAEKVFKDKASITRIIELLIKNEYLTREGHPTHGRMFQFQLTPKGLKTIEQLNQLVPKFRENALAGTSSENIEVSQSLMQIIVENCKRE